MMRALGRIILLPIAFGVAGMATLFVVFSLGQERVVQAISARSQDEVPVDAIMNLLFVGLRFASVHTLVPALLLLSDGGDGAAPAAVPRVVTLGPDLR